MRTGNTPWPSGRWTSPALAPGTPYGRRHRSWTTRTSHALRPDRRNVRFAEQQHTPSADADENLDALALSLARTGLWNHANGLPLPTVTVTGHGNRSRASGQKRAEAVGKALGDRLSRLLRTTFQDGTPGPHVRLSDFTLTLDAQRVRRATDPDRGRVVTVDIDDHRHTSPPGPARLAPAGEPPRTEPPALPRPTADPAASGTSRPTGTEPRPGTPLTRPGTTESTTTSSHRDPARPGCRSAQPRPGRTGAGLGPGPYPVRRGVSLSSGDWPNTSPRTRR